MGHCRPGAVRDSRSSRGAAAARACVRVCAVDDERLSPSPSGPHPSRKVPGHNFSVFPRDSGGFRRVRHHEEQCAFGRLLPQARWPGPSVPESPAAVAPLCRAASPCSRYATLQQAGQPAAAALVERMALTARTYLSVWPVVHRPCGLSTLRLAASFENVERWMAELKKESPNVVRSPRSLPPPPPPTH